EAEPELCFLNPVFDVRLRAMPTLELVRCAFVVVGDEHVVVVAAAVERELLRAHAPIAVARETTAPDASASHEKPPRPLPGLRLPLEAGDLAADAIARRLPVACRDLADPRFHRG